MAAVVVIVIDLLVLTALFLLGRFAWRKVRHR